jgi:hypothetical protein
MQQDRCFFADLTQCIVTPAIPASVDFFARRKVLNNAQGGASVFTVEFFSSTDCSNINSIGMKHSDTTTDAGNGWEEHSFTGFAPPTGTAAVKVELHATGIAPMGGVTLFDHLFFGQSGTMPVKLQTFSVD